MNTPVQMAISTPALLQVVRLAPSTLNSWVDRGLCTPSVISSDGHRATRYWSARDVVVVRTIKALRDAGCSLRKIEMARQLLDEHWAEDFAGAMLLWNGKDVIFHDSTSDQSVSLLAQLGQTMLNEAVMITALPIGRWLADGVAIAEPIDLEKVAASRRARRDSRAS